MYPMPDRHHCNQNKGYIYGVCKAKEHFFTQLPKKAIVPFHKKWEKESKKEGVAQAFREKSNIFCIKLMQSIEFCMWAAKRYDLWL